MNTKTVLIVVALAGLAALLVWFVKKPVHNSNTLGHVLGWDGLFHDDPFYGPEPA